MSRILIYVLRRDLRLADNPVLHDIGASFRQSHRPYTHVLPVYIVPAQQVEVSGFLEDGSAKSPFPEARSQVGGFWRCGPHRARYLSESVWDLKASLEKAGSGLVIRVGMVGQVVAGILDEYKTLQSGEKDEHKSLQSGEKDDHQVQGQDRQQPDGGGGGGSETIHAVWMTGEEGSEERDEEAAVRAAAERHGVPFRLWTDEKYYVHDDDVPLDDIRRLPDVFSVYRKMVEPLRDVPRQDLPAPDSLPPLPDRVPPQAAPFTVPDSRDAFTERLLRPIGDMGLRNPPKGLPDGTQSAINFTGGETAALARVRHYVESGAASSYKDTRNGMLGADFSTKFSAPLALGCITARQIHRFLTDFEHGRTELGRGARGWGGGENKGTGWVRFELLWRDYFRLCTRKFGRRLFALGGFKNEQSGSWKRPGDSSETAEQLRRVLEGTTGIGLVDGSQRELFLTGYTSNRARQNVACFLAKHLGLDWRLGAEWYESLLIDHDVSSNWGNWQYVAGVGNDPRGPARLFNPVKQAHDYDPRADYVRAWLPELRGVAADKPDHVFQAHLLPEEDRAALGLAGAEMVERPLKKISYNKKPGGGGGGNNNNKRGGRGGGRRGGGGGRGDGGGRGGGRGGRGGGGQGSGQRGGGGGGAA